MAARKPQNYRDVTFIIRFFREKWLGRPHNNPDLRFADTVATRSPPPPQLPAGPHSKLSGNYYYTRDARHEVQTPLQIAGPNAALQIESGEEKAKPPPTALLGRTPGRLHNWDYPEENNYKTA